MTPHTGGRYLF